MKRYLLRRLLIIPLSMWVVVTLSFGLEALIPGDPAQAMLGSYATPTEVAAIHHQLELDQPLSIRYWHYLGHLVHGSLGNSYYTNRPVTSDIAAFFPNSLQLVVLALLIAGTLGLTIGAVGGYFHKRWPDAIASTVVSSLQAVPDFVLALTLVYVVFFLLRAAPAPVGMLALTEEPPPTITHLLLVDTVLNGNWSLFGSALSHFALPAMSLGVIAAAGIAKTTRATVGSAMSSPQVEFARACGLPEWQVLRYALLTARTPILTYGAILFGNLVGGAAIIETIFSWPGIGRWSLDSILKLDVPAIQGFVLVTGLATLLIYLILDLTVALLDPRVSYV